MSLRLRRNKKLSRRCINRRRKILRSAGFFVYILRCSDGTFYTGYTKDLKARLKLHNSGRGAKYVRGRTPARCVYLKAFRYYKLAIKEELRVKSLTRLQKKDLIVRGRLRQRTLK
jgi:putative endonuclease